MTLKRRQPLTQRAAQQIITGDERQYPHASVLERQRALHKEIVVEARFWTGIKIVHCHHERTGRSDTRRIGRRCDRSVQYKRKLCR